MPRTIRFHLDEHIDPAVADALRRRGIDVTTAADAGLSGADDDAHLAFADTEARLIVTNDSDFLRRHDQGIPHAGIAYCHQQSHSLGEMIRTLEMIWEILEADDIRNEVEFI